MRLSIVFSLLVGLAALLTIALRFSPHELRVESAAGAGIVKQAGKALAVPGDRAREAILPPVTAVHGQLYRWRDSRGAIHYQTDSPPPGVQADVIRFVREQAIVNDAAPAPMHGAIPDIVESLPGLLSVYTPDGFDDLIRRVEDTARTLRDRNVEIQKLEEQL